MTKLYSRKAENAVKKFNLREITHRQYEVGLWFFHTTLCIIPINTNAKFQSIRLEMTKFCSGLRTILKKLSNSRANNSSCSCVITPIIKLIQDLRIQGQITPVTVVPV